MGIDDLSLCDHCDTMFLLGISGMTGGFDPLILLVLALVFEAIIGNISIFWKWAGSPSNLMRRYRAWCDHKLNRESRSEGDRAIRGGLAAFLLILFAGGFGWVVASLSQLIQGCWILEVLLLVLLIDQRATHTTIQKIGRALRNNELEVARRHLSILTYEVVDQMDAHNIARSGVVTCTNKLVKSVMAPVFWYVLFGLPGLLVYTSVTIMDEQAGNRTQEYRAFGFAAARLNDILLFVPARLAGLFVFIGSFFVPTASPGNALKMMLHYSGKHRSLNTGWPLSAMVGALNIALSTPQRFVTDAARELWIGDGSAQVTARDISRGLYLYSVVCLINIAWVAGLTVLRMM